MQANVLSVECGQRSLAQRAVRGRGDPGELMRDFTSSRSEKKKQPQSTIRERNRIDLILDPDPASETLNPHTRTPRVRANKRNDDSSQDMTQSLPPPPPAPAPLPALTTCAIRCQSCLEMCSFAAWLPCAHTMRAHTHTHTHLHHLVQARSLVLLCRLCTHTRPKNIYTSGMRACWCACAPAKKTHRKKKAKDPSPNTCAI